ncbi:MAG: VanZ family protein [Candidatus Moraniibacteriota bacterium]|nr:MAG: VanZ family protein [Candidatus Moranbacteria bacterium]
MATIFLLSSQPSFGRGDLSMTQYLLRKGVHVFEYFILGVLFFRLFRFHFGKEIRLIAALTALSSLLYALSDEWHQLWIVGRQGRATDVLIDSLGIFLALLFSLALLSFRKRRLR